MEWCCASNIGDCVVPKNLEVSDRFPSPESWLHKWGRTDPGSFPFSNNKGFAIDNFNGEIESCGYDKDWSNSCGGSQESLDYQLLSLAGGFESTDDLYLSSIIDDLQENEEFYNSYSMDPELQNEMILDTKSSSIDTHSMEKARFLAPKCNLPQKYLPSVKSPVGKVLDPCGQNNLSPQVDKETCLEESVLEELGMVMSQMTEKTRLCFRDSLYRLAKNSGQHGVTQNRNGNVLMETSTWTGQEDKTRYKGKKTTESETNTNTIDRTVANLLFNKMDMNVDDNPFTTTSVSSQDGILEANFTSNQQQIGSFPQYLSFSSDNEVPNIQFVQNL